MNFSEAYNLPINKFVEKKGKFSYLSWGYAIKFLRENFPKATWTVRHFDDVPYKFSPAGCFVEVTVFLEGQEFTQIHPILNHQNKVVKEPDAFMVNTSIQRCLTKAISIATGIGLGLYAGEDLADEAIPTITVEQIDQIKDMLTSDKCDEKAFLNWLKIEKVEDIPENRFEDSFTALTKKVAA